MNRWCVLLFLLPLFTEGQELRKYERDVQSNKTLLETFPVTVIEASDSRMEISLRAADTAFFLQLAGSGIGANTIVANDPAIFLLDNDSTVTVLSTTIQGYESNDSIRTYKHEYAVAQKDLEMLSHHQVQAVRKYSVIGFEDIYLAARDGANLKTLAAFFLDKLTKENLLQPEEKAVTIAPAFPGGTAALLSFINKNLKVQPVPETGEPKKALLQFQVNVDGSINTIQIKQSAGDIYDNELLRIWKRMPRWKPALEDGKLSNAMVTQEIHFYKEGTTVRVRF